MKLPDPVEGGLVSFDGCRQSDGTMLEAKGPGYAEHFEGGYPAVWKGFENKLNRQVQLQSRSAGASGRNVEWHFAEKEVADYFREKWKKDYPNIIVIYTPPEDEQ